MTKEQQKKLMQEFLTKQKKEVKLTKKHLEKIINNAATKSLQEYKKIRVMLQDFSKHNFNLEKGDYIAVCEIKNDKNRIFLDADIGNILEPLAPVYKHSKICFQFLDFQKIWNNSVEL